MDGRKKPKFNIGDTVVITIYGTVGKVTALEWLGGDYVYEVNHSEGLYRESSLCLLSDYDGEIIEQEHIDIEYQFFIGDLVQVKEKGSDLYKIVGFRTEIWRYQDDAWEDVRYELSRVGDGEWLEAGEDELILIAEAEYAEAFLQKLGALYTFNKHQQAKKKLQEKWTETKKDNTVQNPAQREKLINRLLDIYNDYQTLYRLFGDEEYLLITKAAIRELKKMTNDEENR